jgi:hypothetical protein
MSDDARKLRYLVFTKDGTRIGKLHSALRDAVLAAATDDGYGAKFQRDGDGFMRLYSTKSRENPPALAVGRKAGI